MTALAADRNTPFKGDNRAISYKVAAATQIFKGAIVCVNATGFLIPAADTAGLLVVGIADENVNNTGADGALSCIVQKGVAGLRGGTTPPVQADVGRAVFVEDDAGVETDSGSVNKIQAGVLDSIGADGLFYVKLFDETAGDTLPVGSVDTAEIADGAVTIAKAAVFVSTEQTGTGASQDIAHGLGVAPTQVFVAPTDLNVATVGDYTVTEGAHDATNVKVTVTTSKKFKVLAWA